MRDALAREAVSPAGTGGTAHRSSLRAWRREWGPLLAALAWFAVTSWVRPLALPDEGRYVGVAWSMLAGGDWLVPALDGLPYFHKPPLFYWITAVSLSVFGHGEWAARMAPLLGAVAGTTAAFLFARRWWGREAARAVLLVLATQPLVFVGAQFANLDMLVAGCIGVTVLAFAHAALAADHGLPRPTAALAAGYAFAALGVLAKGLIGIALPGMVLLAWLLGSGRVRAVRSLLWWPGLALFAAIALPWFVAMQQRYPEFMHYFFVVQHFSRFAQGGFNNQQPWWFYPAVIAALCFPWSAWLAARPRRAAGGDAAGGSRSLMWTWIVLVTVFFSIPRSKLVGYILPVTWPLALLAAQAAAASPAGGRARRLLWPASVAVGAAVGLATVGFAAGHTPNTLRELGRTLAARAVAGDQVAFLSGAFFDLPFYARLRDPVLMVDRWDDPGIAARDNWRRELVDAGRFAPDRAQATLLTPARFAALLCGPRTTWVVGSRADAASIPALAAAQAVATQRDTVLWRVPGGVSGGGCPGTPSANSGRK
ncbi:ArnT family glycosyltransferase [Ramlibacter humi]|uniref:Glycosyltransferase family 39 protein n=1 Tax=Ramlibacter humi TaxID=2530451 RepID=A0A4Z0BFP3_9BURK|nr:glycosyltransferase family 39 protein [Ramlibacter humi]TFY96688.1 glycosyltransferase family 39 protein [Ramlibacter humi]